MKTNEFNLPHVSIIVPCRNEEKFIKKCLESIISQDFPWNRMEILVIDGNSNDNTRKIVEEFMLKYDFIKLIINEKKITPVALNIGIENSTGDIIIRMDAHSIYEKNYISLCVENLIKFNADNIGGLSITLPGKDSLIAKSIAYVLSNPFGVGNSLFRIGVNKPIEVDTVPFGCYKREVFDKIGIFNENLIRNQDIEFNLRLKKAGGKILLHPRILSYYFARSNLKSFFNQNFQNGFWVIYSLKFSKLPFSIRHLIPFFFVSFLIILIIGSLFSNLPFYFLKSLLTIYIILVMFASFQICLKKGLKFFFSLFLSFIILHISYGLGSIFGIFKLIISKVFKNV